MYSKQNLKAQVEPSILKKLREENKYEVIDLMAIKLLTWNRLDLAFKLFYLDNKDRIREFAHEVYKQDIKAQTLGSFEEFDNNEKNDFPKYLEAFAQTYDDIRANGFNPEKSLIPLSKEYTILNGAHRIASAVHLNKTVKCIDTKLPIVTCDYRYFLERNVPQDILEIVVQTFIEYAQDTYIAFLWPSGNDRKEEALSKFNNVVYHKKIKFTPQGGLNLIIELYKHMNWLGDQVNGFRGAKQKLIECFPKFDSFDIVVFQSNSINKVRSIKDEIRKIYNIGYSSIHITDTKEEATRIAKLIFNENGRHFLNYASPWKFESTLTRISQLQEFLDLNNIQNEDFLVDGGQTLYLYGLRNTEDVDYFVNEELKIFNNFPNFNKHDNELEYHKQNKNTLIYDPHFHFYYNEIKFVSFDQLYHMKKRRNEKKDYIDCNLMEAFLSRDNFKLKLFNLKQKLLYSKIKIYKSIHDSGIKILKVLHLYKFFQKLYWKFVLNRD